MSVTRILSLLTISAVLVFTVFGANAAVNLTPDQTKNFVESMDEVKTLATAIKENGKNEALSKKAKELAGEKFSPYTNNVKALKATLPEDYQKLGDVTAQHGFASQEEWASVGDSVMLTYFALRSEQANPNYAKMAANVTPDVLAKMTPEARTQFAKANTMVQAMQGVSPEAKDMVKPYIAQIDQNITPEKK